MYIPDIIKKKRDKKSLTEFEIKYLIDNYTAGSIPDYQMASFLMAGFINGFDESETKFLTMAMMYSGDVYDFSDIAGIKADKHSTGGVGDKVSIPLAPVLAELGMYVPMVSGRGLGHTGGTLDKLESIEGFNVNLDKVQFRKNLKAVHVVMAGQTESFVPADKKLYALRDVTGTVESIPLITASIMSKKMAEGIDTLFLDVKAGSGAFMKNFESAKLLADNMFRICEMMGKKVVYSITDMSEVLGDYAGNGCEIYESIKILKGESSNNASEAVKETAKYMLMKCNLADDSAEAEKMYCQAIDSGKAYERFLKMVEAQNGDARKMKYEDLVYKNQKDILSDKAGYLESIDTYAVGIALIHLKAGRFKKEDGVDHKTGIFMHKHIGDRIEKNEPVISIFHCGDYEDAENILKSVFKVSENKVEKVKLFKYTRGI